MPTEVELVLDSKAILGEGPLWDPDAKVLWWVNIFAGELHRFDPQSENDDVFQIGEAVGTVVLQRSGGVALALENGFASFDPGTQTLKRLADPESHISTNRFNDGKCDPKGRFWAGTMSKVEDPGHGILYSLDGDGKVKKHVQDISVSNGIVWSSDSKTMYYIDSPTKRIDAFDYDLESGEISNRRTAVKVEDGLGFPDGMAIDVEDKLWVGMWGGSQVIRYDPLSGSILSQIPVPSAHVTACAFGGEDLHDLYITTARDRMTSEQLQEQPHAGGLFRARVPVKGTLFESFNA